MKNLYSFLANILKNPLIKNSGIVFAGTMTANVASYLYHLILGRILGPVGYGELAALVSLLYIFGVPTIVVQTVLVKFFSQYKAQGELGKTRNLFNKATKSLVVLLVIAVLILIAISPLITDFLHLSSWRLIVWLSLFFAFSTLSFINNSVLQGYQKFIYVAIFAALPVTLKVLLSIPMAYLGLEWVMIAAGIASIISYLLFILPIRFVFKVKVSPIELTKKNIIGFSLPTLLTILGTTSLYSSDIILAKHFLTPAQAGIYSAVAIMGKIIFFASSAITLVVYPTVSERKVKGENSNRIILSALTLIGFISVIITLMYMLIPDLIIKYLFGQSFMGAVPYIGIFGVFISLYSLAQCLSMINLALNNVKIGLISISAAVMQIILISIFHSSINVIISVNIATALTFLIISLIFYKLSKTD